MSIRLPFHGDRLRIGGHFAQGKHVRPAFSRARLLAAGIFCGVCARAIAEPTNLYHYNVTNILFEATNLPAGTPTVSDILKEEERLERLVGPFNVQTNAIWAMEYETVAWGYPNAPGAWTTVLGYYSPYNWAWWPSCMHTNHFFDNVGWVKGVRSVPGSGGATYGASLWFLQNTIQFTSSTTDVYVSSAGVTSSILRVQVGSLGDYNPSNRVTDIGPTLDTNYPGWNTFTTRICRADTRAFYKLPLKAMIPCNDGDLDGDSIPDFADGFNWDGTASNDDATTNAFFQPWKLTLPAYVDVSNTLIKFEYSNSPPAGVTRTGSPGSYIYTPATGTLRVWTRSARLSRDKRPVLQGGHFVEATGYKATDLGFTPDKKSINLFIEGIRPSTNQPDTNQSIRVTYSHKGAPWLTLDAVNPSIIKVDMAMDGNRDDSIDFDDPDDAKYLFWINDDVDVISGGEEDDAESGTANCNDSVITCKRDLEDFTRLHIMVDTNIANMSGITYWMKFDNPVSGVPTANIFEAISQDLDYLQDDSAADLQIQKIKIITVGSSEVQLPSQYIKTGGQISPFILEGKTAGNADLTIIVKKDGNVLYKKAVQLDLRPISEFRQIFAASITTDDNISTTASQIGTYTYTPETDEYVLYVHGWNMDDWEKDRWTETVFKRLWWQRYKGHVGGFQWPTLGTLYYDRSELRSWNSAQALNNLITSLNSSHPGGVRVIAHSMGNVVMGEALRLFSSSVVHTYLAAQAAIPAHCYDNMIANYWGNFTTPNVYGHYTSGQSPDVSYLAANSNRAGRLVQYYNGLDYALGWWENNNEMKPDINYHYTEGDANVDTYAPTSGDRFYYDSLLPLDERTMVFPADRFEIFARSAESRSRALGRIDSVTGFGHHQDLQDFGYDGAHYSHSREFRSNIVAEWPFWEAVKSDFGLSQ